MTTDAPDPAGPREGSGGTPPPAPVASRPLPLAGRLGLELLVVFVGVYAASLLAGHQAQRAEAERTHALHRAIQAELSYIYGKGEELELSSLVAYADAIERGAQPALRPFVSRVPFTPDVWDAALASGGVQLLEPELVIDLAQFYGAMRSFVNELETHRTYTREILLPSLGQPLSEYYDDAGMIRPKYQWYLDFLRWLPDEAGRLTTAAEQLRNRFD